MPECMRCKIETNPPWKEGHATIACKNCIKKRAIDLVYEFNIIPNWTCFDDLLDVAYRHIFRTICEDIITNCCGKDTTVVHQHMTWDDFYQYINNISCDK